MPIYLAEQLPEYARYADVPPCYDPEKALKEFNALTPEQKGNFGIGIAVAASSNEANQEFEKASSAAATAVYTIEMLFITLTAKFDSIPDAQEFLKQFTAIQKTFRDLVKDSRNLAVTIAQYADSFDEIIVKFCADKRLTVQQRIAKIEEFIAKADSIKKDEENMQERFTNLEDQFANFVGSFSTWAKKREEADQQSITDLYAEIAKLDEQIRAIGTAMTVVSAGLGATLPITGILAVAFPLAAPWIIGVGAAIAGVELVSLTGLAIARNILLNEKSVKEGKIMDLQDEISKIKATRTQLEKDGGVALITFTINMLVIQNVWTKVVNQATEIQKWLQEGADEAHYTEYMKISLEKGVEVYSKMGKYLRDYADGVTKTVRSFED